MKIKLLYLVMAVFCLSLAACSKDEDENEKEQVVEYSESDVVGTWEPTHIKGYLTYKPENSTIKIDKDLKSGEVVEFKYTKDASASYTFDNQVFYANHKMESTGNSNHKEIYDWSLKDSIITAILTESKVNLKYTYTFKDANTLEITLKELQKNLHDVEEENIVTFKKKK